MRYKKNRGVAPSSGKTQLSIIAQNQNRELGRGGGGEQGEGRGSDGTFVVCGSRKGEII